MFNPGTLIVKPQSAELLEDLDSIGKMDPLVKVTIGSNTQQTPAANGMGKLPSWNSKLTYKTGGEHAILVSVLDYDSLTSADFIGECTIQMQDVISRGCFSNWYEIKKNGETAGKVFITFEYSA